MYIYILVIHYSCQSQFPCYLGHTYNMQMYHYYSDTHNHLHIHMNFLSLQIQFRCICITFPIKYFWHHRDKNFHIQFHQQKYIPSCNQIHINFQMSEYMNLYHMFQHIFYHLMKHIYYYYNYHRIKYTHHYHHNNHLNTSISICYFSQVQYNLHIIIHNVFR